MSGTWSITNVGTSGTAASATLVAPSSQTAQGQQTRVRAVSATLGGATAGSDTLQLKDGTAVVKSWFLSKPTNGFASIQLAGLDIRINGNLTLAFTTGLDTETVNAEGDFVQAGVGYGVNPS